VAFNISNFKAVMDKHGGPARTSLFEVEMAGAPLFQNSITTDDLRFFCQSISVPGINLETTPYKPTGIGFPESMPMNTTPDALNCVFMLDSNHKVITFFHRWISSVINVSAARGDTGSGLPRHQIEYKSNYTAASMTVRHYSTSDPFRSYQYVFYSVYPTQVSPVDLAWATKDTPATVTVNFSYSKIEYSGFQNISFETSRNFVGSEDSVLRGKIDQFLTSGPI
jgi:hypothetical protein